MIRKVLAWLHSRFPPVIAIAEKDYQELKAKFEASIVDTQRLNAAIEDIKMIAKELDLMKIKATTLENAIILKAKKAEDVILGR